MASQAPPSVLPQETIRRTGLLSLTPEQIKRAVFVKDISEKATIKNVADFFGFVGTVEKLVQDVDPNAAPKQFAVVVYEGDGPYQTALLLGQAMIGDSPITVYPYVTVLEVNMPGASTFSGSGSEVTSGLSAAGVQVNSSGLIGQVAGQATTALTGGQTSASPSLTLTTNANRQPTTPDRSATAVIGALVEQGFVRGEQLVQQMKSQASQLDSQTQLSQRARLAYQISRQKASELDNSLQLTHKFNQLKANAGAGVQVMGQELGRVADAATNFTSKAITDLQVKEMATAAKTATMKATAATLATTTAITNKALEVEAIKQTKQVVDSWASAGWSFLKTGMNQVVNIFDEQPQDNYGPSGSRASSSGMSSRQNQHVSAPPSRYGGEGGHSLLGDDDDEEEEPDFGSIAARSASPTTTSSPVPAATSKPAQPEKKAEDDLLKFE